MNDKPKYSQRQPARVAEPTKQAPIKEASVGNQPPAVISRDLPEPVARRGITEEQWRTLKDNLYPGATNNSCLMVWDYCKARRLDPMKKPCHIVPMEVSVKNQETGAVSKVWRDVVMPGIYEYRTTAMRTGLYLGHSEPEFGPRRTILGVEDAPEWCKMVFYRWNEKANRQVEFPTIVYFDEICATKWDKETGEQVANARWKKADNQMLEKCTEAAGLRKTFPDEIGGEHTIEEMEGRVLGDDSKVVHSLQPGQSRVAAATEALKATVKQNVPRESLNKEPAVSVARSESTSNNFSKPVEKQEVGYDGYDWIKHWRDETQACTTADDVIDCRKAILEHYDGSEVPLDVEAALHLKLEEFDIK